MFRILALLSGCVASCMFGFVCTSLETVSLENFAYKIYSPTATCCLVSVTLWIFIHKTQKNSCLTFDLFIVYHRHDNMF